MDKRKEQRLRNESNRKLARGDLARGELARGKINGDNRKGIRLSFDPKS